MSNYTGLSPILRIEGIEFPTGKMKTAGGREGGREEGRQGMSKEGWRRKMCPECDIILILLLIT